MPLPVLLAARLWFEGNRFSPRPTGRAQLLQREWQRGDAALAAAAGTATELAAVAALAQARRPRWRVEVSRCASASPGGPMHDDVFAAWQDEVLADVWRLRPQAMYLSLHGAAITDRRDSPELDAVQALRQALGPGVPLGVSLDLHANLPPGLVDLVDAASAYRSYPHVDMRETAERVLERLRVLADGAPPAQGVRVPTGLLLPSFEMRTDGGPMHELQALARAAEAQPGIVEVSLLGGFPYADVPQGGASVMVWADRADRAGAVGERLAGEVAGREASFRPRLRPAVDALRAAAAMAQGLVAVTDPADNPLSGGAADTPGLFAALLAERRDPTSPLASWPDGRVVFAYFADPRLVQRAHEAGTGAWLDCRLGARSSQAYGPPVDWRACVQQLGDGRFVNRGPMERGSAVRLGRTAVLAGDGLRVIVTEAVGAANDPAFFESLGITLEAPLLLVVKAKNHFRAAFEPLCAAILDADLPGPAAADLGALPMRHRRPTAA